MEWFWGTFGWLAALVIICGFILAMRYIRFRERTALLEKGYTPEQISRVTGDRRDVRVDAWGRERRTTGDLVGGSITFVVGLIIFLVMLPIGFVVSTGFPLGVGPWLIAGLVPMFVGLALVVTHWTTPGRSLRGGVVTAMVGLALLIGLYPIGMVTDLGFPFGLGPWLLGGLIPLFVGIVIIIADLVTGPPPLVERSLATTRPVVASGDARAPFEAGATDVRPASIVHSGDDSAAVRPKDSESAS